MLGLCAGVSLTTCIFATARDPHQRPPGRKPFLSHLEEWALTFFATILGYCSTYLPLVVPEDETAELVPGMTDRSSSPGMTDRSSSLGLKPSLQDAKRSPHCGTSIAAQRRPADWESGWLTVLICWQRRPGLVHQMRIPRTVRGVAACHWQRGTMGIAQATAGSGFLCLQPGATLHGGHMPLHWSPSRSLDARFL